MYMPSSIWISNSSTMRLPVSVFKSESGVLLSSRGCGRRSKSDGTVAYIGEYLSGGAGGRLNTGGPVDPLISAHSVLNVDNRFVLQVNAGSNTISSFRAPIPPTMQ